MSKSPIFFTILLLAIASGAIGMRTQGITWQDLLGSVKISQITKNLLESDKPDTPQSSSGSEIISSETGSGSEVFAESEEVASLPGSNPDGSEPSLFEEIFGNSEETESTPIISQITLEDVPALTADIQAALQNQDLQTALTLSEDLVTVQVPDPEFFNPIIIPAIMQLHEFERAFALAQTIRDAHSDSALAWNWVGWSAMNANHMDTAKQALSQALVLDDTLPQIHLNYGDLWLLEGNHQKAKEFYQYAISLDGPDGVITQLAQTQLDKINQLN